MSKLIERIKTISEEVENFPLGNCSPSDDPDMQTAYLYPFKDLAKRFVTSLKRLDDARLVKMLETIDLNPEYITEAYDLKADLQTVIDYLNDSDNLRERIAISSSEAKELSDVILDILSQESANNLSMICTGYGLEEGTTDEAFKSKWNYVYKRISHFDNLQILELGKKMSGKYPESKLDELITKYFDSDSLGLISEFENIKQFIISELSKAKYVIWVAVAWFTDKDLANLLYTKAKQGVNIQILLNDDEINSTLKEKLKEHFEIYFTPSDDKYKKLMHNKFCIIDLEKVIHGSYNWTNKAQYNNETISIIDSRLEAKKFADQFLKIKQGLNARIL
jgi:phosphatidylserine/phosphatidylglycerophosphate/cardiolipin synthase-like enzyme